MDLVPVRPAEPEPEPEVRSWQQFEPTPEPEPEPEPFVPPPEETEPLPEPHLPFPSSWLRQALLAAVTAAASTPVDPGIVNCQAMWRGRRARRRVKEDSEVRRL